MTGHDDARRPQRRGRAIEMSAPERDDFLATQATCRVASLNGDGSPHVTPLWFCWDGDALWLYSLVRGQRWANLVRDPRISVAIDAGDAYSELHGVQITGSATVVGDVPRTEVADDELARPEQLFAAKYAAGRFRPDGRHAWLKVTPHKIVSWDFRKLGTHRDG